MNFSRRKAQIATLSSRTRCAFTRYPSACASALRLAGRGQRIKTNIPRCRTPAVLRATDPSPKKDRIESRGQRRRPSTCTCNCVSRPACAWAPGKSLTLTLARELAWRCRSTPRPATWPMPSVQVPASGFWRRLERRKPENRDRDIEARRLG